MTAIPQFDEPEWVADYYDRRGGGSPPLPKFELIPFSQITFTEGERWLVKGILPANGLATIFGAKKEYKSFVSLDLGLHIAQGEPWAGRKVKQGAVVYVVAEGSSGFSDRVAANRIKSKLASNLPFFLVKAKPNLGVGEGDTTALIEAVHPVLLGRGLTLAAIFIDTLVRTLAGSDENDAGMRNFTDNAERIAEHFSCLTIAVHHVGKDASRGMRGSSALPAAVVASWLVEKVKPLEARITIADSKDGESDLTWSAHLERYVFRVDADGDEETVLLMREVTEPARADPIEKQSASAGRKVPPQLQLFMACLATAMSCCRRARPYPDGPEIDVVPMEAVRTEYFARRGDDATEDAKRVSFNRQLASGVERRIINVETLGTDKFVWKSNTA